MRCCVSPLKYPCPWRGGQSWTPLIATALLRCGTIDQTNDCPAGQWCCKSIVPVLGRKVLTCADTSKAQSFNIATPICGFGFTVLLRLAVDPFVDPISDMQAMWPGFLWDEFNGVVWCITAFHIILDTCAFQQYFDGEMQSNTHMYFISVSCLQKKNCDLVNTSYQSTCAPAFGAIYLENTLCRLPLGISLHCVCTACIFGKPAR